MLAFSSSFANMASPYIEGSKTSSALSSKQIDVLREQIFIKIDKEFKTAKYTIIYTIDNKIETNRIPLLFLALDYKDEFKVWLNNLPVKTENITDDYREDTSIKFQEFNNNFIDTDGVKQVKVFFEKDKYDTYSLTDLKYFEAPLKKGIHQIKVEYTAEVWEDRSDWVKKLSFRYSLSPAKHWRSFKSLSIRVEQEGNQVFSANIGRGKKAANQYTYWVFDQLPSEVLIFTHQAKVSKLASQMIMIGPDGFMWITFCLLTIFHLIALYVYRNSTKNKRTVILIAGSLLIPFITFLIYNLSFGFIDEMIGPYASKHHGYYILIFGLYPIVMPIYWLAMFLINKYIYSKI